uniref:EamA family transporter RarD n=1 Tax=Thaumasiovibrio occultus TaxID=1891184 RepID=UPI000B352340|nr:EamA family transporter RarD [Thaumasiovibrio occultus]
MQPTRFGNVMAATSFLIWGLLPLYYQYLPSPNMEELLALRIIGSVPFGLLVLWAMERKMPNFTEILADKRSLFFSGVAGILMCVSWYAFTWAITNGQVLEASLGFFITPIMVVALGVFILKDKLTHGQTAAVVLAIIGIGYQIYHYGEVPYVALTMAIFFTFYGLCKKQVAFSPLTTLWLESLILTPVALAFMFYKSATTGSVAFSADPITLLLYLGAAPVTLAPLVFYSIAVKHTTLSMVGLMQYIEPSLQFLLAVLLFAEPFDEIKAVGFGFIWLGLAITTAEALAKRGPKQQGPKAPLPGA